MVRRRSRPGIVKLAPIAVLVMALGAGCGDPAPSTSPTPTSSDSTAATPSESATPTPSETRSPSSGSCADLAAGLSIEEQVGQLFMVGINSEGLRRSEAKILADAHAGSVILLGNTQSGSTAVKSLTNEVRDAIRAPEGVRTMLAADQEGGQVQRLRGQGLDRMPTAEAQAELSDADLTTYATLWGKQLSKAGIDANLAPVADLVSTSLVGINEPVSRLQRGYGSDPKVVAKKVAAFIKGMDSAGIATSVKHFPGLGAVKGNTDFTARVVDSTTTRGDSSLRAFTAGAEAGADMVMVSTATYSKIDKDNRAAFSSKIIQGMVRDDLDFHGVVISDDLAAKAVADLSPGRRALKFLDAGGDLVIMGDPSLVPAMVEAVVARAQSDKDFAADLGDKATRVIEMKSRRGLADCS